MPRYDGGNADPEYHSSIVVESETSDVTSAHVVNTWPVPVKFTVRKQFSLRDPARPNDWNDHDGDGQVVWGPVTVPANTEQDVDLSETGIIFKYDSPYYGDEYLGCDGGSAIEAGGEIQMMARPEE